MHAFAAVGAGSVHLRSETCAFGFKGLHAMPYGGAANGCVFSFPLFALAKASKKQQPPRMSETEEEVRRSLCPSPVPVPVPPSHP